MFLEKKWGSPAIKVDVGTCINDMQLLLHWSWRKCLSRNLVPRVFLSFWRQRRKGRETLGTRLIWPDIRHGLVPLSVSVCTISTQARAQLRRESKNCAWPCASFYAYFTSHLGHVLFYVRLFLRSCLCNLWKQGLYAIAYARPALLELRVALVLLLAWLMKLCFLSVFKSSVSSVYVKKKKEDCKYNY